MRRPSQSGLCPLLAGLVLALSACGSSTAPSGNTGNGGGSSTAPLGFDLGNPQADASASCAQPSAARAGEKITVGSAFGQVQIQRQPFQLAVLDTSGKTVLAEMPNTLPLPGPYVQPTTLPGGLSLAPHITAYAPLGFVTGATVSVAYPALFWAGNLLAGLSAGLQYTACRVEMAQVLDDELVLTLSTNDPAGSTFQLRVSAASDHAFRIAATLSSPLPNAAVVDSFAADASEAFHGFGGRQNAINQRGQFLYNWLEEENFGGSPLDPVLGVLPGAGPTYLFPNGPTAAYYPQSLFYSSSGYGFLLNQFELSLWSMASDRPDAWQLAVAAGKLDYTVAPGDYAQSIAAITAITGRQSLPPAWAMGAELDRAQTSLSTDPNAPSYTQLVDQDLANIAQYQLPLTAYRLEAWDAMSADQAQAYAAKIRALGLHPVAYFRSFVSTQAHGGGSVPYNEALNDHYVATNALGQPYLFLSPEEAPAAVIDYTAAGTVPWWQGRVGAALDLGFDGFMEDFGEQVTPDMRFADGESGAQMHNYYPLPYHHATRTFLDRYAAAHPGRELYYFNRSGYTGMPGSAADEYANFPGDELTDFDHSAGLAALASDMLNRAVGGAWGYTTDIGGYLDLYTGATSKELLLRWSEWAALSPFFRLHNSPSSGTRMPWDFDQETLDDYRAMATLHQRAIPLIRQLWQQGQASGIPPLRPLWLAYPDDPNTASLDQEWLLGPDVLVAPVVTQGATTQAVYLPQGCWTYVPSGMQYNGSVTITVAAPLGTLPYFFRCGTQPF